MVNIKFLVTNTLSHEEVVRFKKIICQDVGEHLCVMNLSFLTLELYFLEISYIRSKNQFVRKNGTRELCMSEVMPNYAKILTELGIFLSSKKTCAALERFVA